MVSFEDNTDKSTSDISVPVCPNCGKEIKPGKKKKKFCNNHCGHIYRQRIRRKSHKYAYKINAILIKNRDILHGLLPQDSQSIKVSREVLKKRKYQFDYHTQVLPARNGSYIYCYEYGYMIIENGLFLIIRKTIT